ncbi:MAG: hypothetical protein EBR09_02750 [Proteobacteria bacterium]|nr:hypothetical protein [Pseudomonadota bacterium]
MKTKLSLIAVTLPQILTVLSCKPRDFNAAELQSATPKPDAEIHFCNAKDAQTLLWNAERVQLEIQKLINEQGHKSSGLSVYAEVYLAMTRARDTARCDSKNSMFPRTELNQKLNDALADEMTKGLVAGQRACLFSFANPQKTIPAIGRQLCQLNRAALNEKWSALELAMGSTAVYLTSIMGLSLSALPHADVLWLKTPYQSLESRLEYIRNEFKPVYDAFNVFLSNNLHTVADVLVRENRVGCNLFRPAAKFAEITGAPAAIFGNIRDKTFEFGLELSKTWPRGLHPFTAGEPAWNVEKTFAAFAKEPDALKGLQEHTLRSAALLSQPMFKAFKNKDASTYISGAGLTCPIPVK